MAKAIETLSIKLEFKDAGTQQIISKLSSSLKGMTNVVKGNTSPAISKLRNEILSVGKASTQSISNFRNQANALRALRDEARVGSATFKKLTEDIKKLDAQMAKGQGRKRGGMGARATTQIAGAVVSGGIFGGPEGALGALGGAALGGVEGAFAGAAVGAQLGAIRESLSAAADYASQIQKLQIALRGVAGSQENYNSALETAAQVTSTLNVPQQEAVRGVTRLTAAVTGAGGPIRDAETTFKNVTAAIKATGGSTEDVQGAITAMVQVFSKGKVSAEELSGQLGERLPGAVTLFAKANDMTLPELQKNLKAGTVGLNELMAFIEELGVKYSGTASKIASSNAEAGARLTVAFDDMKAKVGAALLDTGAEFQDTFGKFIKDITPAMVKAAETIAGAMSALARNLKPILAGLATFVSIITGAALVSTVTNLAAGLGLLGVAAKGAATGIGALTASMALSPLFAGALAVSGIVAGIVAVTNALGRQKRELQEIAQLKSGQTMANLSNEERLEKINATKRLKGAAVKELRDREASGLDYGVNAVRMSELREEIAGYDERLARLTAPVKKKEEDKPFDYGSPTADDSDSGAKKLARRIEQAQALESRMQRLNHLAQQDTQLGRILAQQDNQRAVLKEKISKLTEGAYNAEVERATTSAQNLQNEKLAAELKEKVGKLAEKATKPLQDGIKAIKDQIAAEKRHAELIKKGISPERAKAIIKLEEEKKVALKILDALIDELKIRVAKGEAIQAEIDLLEELKKKRKETEETDPKKVTQPLDKTKTEFEQFQETFKEGLKDMINIGPKLANVALNAIGSVTDGLIEMITTGKANFREMTAAILKDIAKILMRAALAKIVASAFGISLNAKGNVIEGGSVKPYAKGGVVAGPTVFPMAGGDVGLMGEAGPEAIMPLKRGANGKLGVEVAGRSNAIDAMNRYSRRNAGAAGGGMASEDEAIAAVQGSATQPIDVRYTVERINNVDYVTADQFQAGMRQAASQGAKQGEQQTLKRLQMSSSTRKRLGM